MRTKSTKNRSNTKSRWNSRACTESEAQSYKNKSGVWGNKTKD